MSGDLAVTVRLGLGALATIRDQMSPLIAMPPDSKVDVIETAAACAMLHSFYTEIEKILKLVAREFLTEQMAVPTSARPAVITKDPVEVLSEFLAVRHLFRGASIALMRWDKLAPLIARVDQVYRPGET